MSQSEIKQEQLFTASTVKPVLFSLLILISGIIIGAGLTLITSDYLKNPKRFPSGPEYMSNRMIQQIIRELRLSPEQQKQIRPIINQHIEAIDDIRNEARPKINQELKSMNEEILGILNEPQQLMWRQQMRRMQDHFTRMRQHRGQEGKRRMDRGQNPEMRRDPPRRQQRFRDQRPPQPMPPGSEPEREPPP